MGRVHGRAQSSLPRCHLAAPEAVLAAAGSARLRPSRVWVAVIAAGSSHSQKDLPNDCDANPIPDRSSRPVWLRLCRAVIFCSNSVILIVEHQDFRGRDDDEHEEESSISEFGLKPGTKRNPRNRFKSGRALRRLGPQPFKLAFMGVRPYRRRSRLRIARERVPAIGAVYLTITFRENSEYRPECVYRRHPGSRGLP